jgi:molybdopterin synthase catalytic subunit
MPNGEIRKKSENRESTPKDGSRISAERYIPPRWSNSAMDSPKANDSRSVIPFEFRPSEFFRPSAFGFRPSASTAFLPLSCMKKHLLITTEPINEQALVAQRSIANGMGAVVSFLGVVRDREADEPIRALEYEAFKPMAEHQFNRLLDELSTRWPVESVRLIHRVGQVNAGEPSLWVEVIAPHRAEAFAAGQWLIDEMKRVVPIWKKPLA